MAVWQVRTQARNSTAISYLHRLQDRRCSFYLNRPPEMSGTISAESGNATSLGVRPGIDEALLLRDGEPLESVFVCTSNSITGSREEIRVGIEWKGIASYLQDGLVRGKGRTAYSGTTLPWTWINSFQSRTGGSVYGITQGTQTGTPPTRSRLLEQDGTLLDEIIQLSETSSGFDWNIDTNRAYNEWHTTRGNSNSLVLEYGVNVEAFSYTEDVGPGEIVNDVRVIGPPGSSIASSSDSTSQTTYGLREASLQYLTELENATVTSSQLSNYATAAITARKNPLIIPSLTLRTVSGVGHPSVAWGSYWLGDTVRFRASVGAFGSIDASYRIVAIHVEIDENNNETINLEVNAA